VSNVTDRKSKKLTRPEVQKENEETAESALRCWMQRLLDRYVRGLHAATVLSGIAALVVSLLVGVFVLQRHLNIAADRLVRQQALTRATDVAEMMSRGQHRPQLDYGGLPGWVQVVDQHRSVLTATQNIAFMKTAFAPTPLVLAAELRTDIDRDTTIASGLSINSGNKVALATVMGIRPNGPFVVLAAVPLDLTIAAKRNLDRTLLLGFPALIFIDALIVWWLIRRALRPVEAIRSQVATITATDLHLRVPLPPGEDSIQRLANTMNAMLGRLEIANEQTKQFCADAAHELRSPLASIRTQLEVSALENPDPSWTAMVNDLLIDQSRLELLVSDLFILTRLDAYEPFILDPVDLGALVRHELDRRPVPTGQIRTVDASSGVILGNENAIVRVLRNLVSNAERHAISSVHITVNNVAENGVALSVSNDGAPIPEEKSSEIFQRFTRLDDSRHRDEGGAGLGLAIVSELMRNHNGTVALLPGSQGATFVATFVGLAPEEPS
jgi:signal transduction histidine kinase